MKTSRVFLLLGILLAALFLSACGNPNESWPGVAADDPAAPHVIYAAYNERVVALDAVSGDTLWKYSDEDDAKFYAEPVYGTFNGEAVVYVGDYKGKLHAINAANGERLWVYEPDRHKLIGPISTSPIDRVIGGAAIDSNKIFFGLGSRNVVAISRETGEEVWSFETDHGVWGKPLYRPAQPGENPAPATVYVVSLDHYLYALNAETGDLQWKKDLGGAVPGNMVYDETRQRVYVGTFVSELLAVDLSTHEIVARYETKDWVWGSPVLEDDTLYFGDLSGNLYAVRVTDQGFEELWRESVAEGAIRTTPTLTDELVIVGAKDKFVYAVHKTDGSAAWSRETRGEVLGELFVVSGNPDNAETASNLVVAGTTEKDRLIVAYKLDSENQDEAWHYSD